MMNPGYTARIAKTEEDIPNAGVLLYCPKCNSKMMQADAAVVYTRCKSCGWWVLLRRTAVNRGSN